MTPADRPGPGETLAVGGALPGVMGWPVPYGGLRGRGSAWLQCLPSRPKVKKLDHGPDAVRVRAGGWVLATRIFIGQCVPIRTQTGLLGILQILALSVSKMKK